MHKFKSVLYVLIVFILFINYSIGFAQTGTGGQAGEFLRYGVGGKALAMGRAFTSIADDASAMYWNPAGIAQFNQTNLGFMQSQLFLDTRYQFLGLASPLDFLRNEKIKHTIGFGFINLKTDDFEGRDAGNHPTHSFNAQQYAIMIPYAVNFINSWGSFNVGVKPQLFNQSIDGDGGMGLGLDVGVIYQPLSPRRYTLLGLVPLKYLMPWRIGVNFRTLSSIKLLNETQDFPNSLNIGISNAAFEDILDLLIPGSNPFSNLPVKILFSYEYEKIFNVKRAAKHHIGNEMRYRIGSSLIASFRWGYRFGRTEFENKFNWGFGLGTDADWLAKTPLVKGLALDFAQISHPDLDNAFHVYFTMKLGTWKNNVRRISNPNDATDPELLHILSEYPFDDRIVQERSGLDVTYKDTVAAQLSTHAENILKDPFLMERYDDFMGGLRKIDKKVEVAWANISCDFDRATFDDLKKQYEEKKKDLSKSINYASLKWYLKVLLVLGEIDKVKKIVAGQEPDIKNEALTKNGDDRDYFFAFASKEPAYCARVVQNYKPKNIYRDLLLKLTAAVYTEDASGVAGLLTQSRAEVYSSNFKEYEPFPILCDGILADDIMFIAAYQKSKSLTDAKAIRDLFLPIAIVMPYTDLGRAISMKLKSLYTSRDSYDGTQLVFDQIWQEYKQLFKSNQVINLQALLKTKITKTN